MRGDLPHQPHLIRVQLLPSGRGTHLEMGQPQQFPHRPQGRRHLRCPAVAAQGNRHLVRPADLRGHQATGVLLDLVARPAGIGQGSHQRFRIGAAGLSEVEFASDQRVGQCGVPASGHG